MNAGAAAASGQLLAFMHADTLVSPANLLQVRLTCRCLCGMLRFKITEGVDFSQGVRLFSVLVVSSQMGKNAAQRRARIISFVVLGPELGITRFIKRSAMPLRTKASSNSSPLRPGAAK